MAVVVARSKNEAASMNETQRVSMHNEFDDLGIMDDNSSDKFSDAFLVPSTIS